MNIHILSNVGLGFFVFIFGSIIGSFLNVVILRHNTNLKKNRSFCFSCGHILQPIELVPIFSYLFLGGKCRHCKSKISPQYFFVEFFFAIISTILVFVLKDLSLNIWLFRYLIMIAFFALLTSTFVYDIRHKIMPDEWTLGAFVLALVYSILFGIGLKMALIGGFLVGLPLLLLNLISRGRVMGMGDVKFAPVMGVLLGASAGFAALMVSFWLGGLVGVYLLFKYKNTNKKITGKSEIPFGPFLVVSTFIVFVLGINIDTIIVCFQQITALMF